MTQCIFIYTQRDRPDGQVVNVLVFWRGRLVSITGSVKLTQVAMTRHHRRNLAMRALAQVAAMGSAKLITTER